MRPQDEGRLGCIRVPRRVKGITETNWIETDRETSLDHLTDKKTPLVHLKPALKVTLIKLSVPQEICPCIMKKKRRY